jgi:hypothetical protein
MRAQHDNESATFSMMGPTGFGARDCTRGEDRVTRARVARGGGAGRYRGRPGRDGYVGGVWTASQFQGASSAIFEAGCPFESLSRTSYR